MPLLAPVTRTADGFTSDAIWLQHRGETGAVVHQSNDPVPRDNNDCVPDLLAPKINEAVLEICSGSRRFVTCRVVTGIFLRE
jgi:hypothetical protein